MITKNAENTFILGEFWDLLAKQQKLRPNEGSEFFWRAGPDIGYSLARMHYDGFFGTFTGQMFQDKLFDLPVNVEWDFPTGTMELRNRFTALVRVTNIGQSKL